MVAGQVGEAMAVAVVPVVAEQNTDTDLVLILDQGMADVLAVDLPPRHHHAIFEHVQVLPFNFLEVKIV